MQAATHAAAQLARGGGAAHQKTAPLHRASHSTPQPTAMLQLARVCRLGGRAGGAPAALQGFRRGFAADAGGESRSPVQSSGPGLPGQGVQS